jgi:type II secretory pathway predicted ATPase ExeA
MAKNPFTPTFGSEPLFLVGREHLISDVVEGLQNGPGDPNRATIFTGPRGSGKTVLMSRIVEEAQQEGWVSVTVIALPGLLDSIIEQVERRAKEFLPQPAKSRITGIKVGGAGISRESIPDVRRSWRAKMEDILDTLAQQGIGLLIAIDELDPSLDELIQLAADFQLLKSERRDIALIMAGLPDRVYQLLQNKSVSFLRRAFHRRLGSIRQSDVKMAIKKTVEMSGRSIEKQALEEAAQQTKGYPIMIQLIGYHSWKQSDGQSITLEDVHLGTEVAWEDLRDMLIDSTLRDISPTDRRFLEAMAQDDGESQLADVAGRMGVSTKYASQYRRRLLEQGIIGAPSRGRLVFSIPMLREYLRDE